MNPFPPVELGGVRALVDRDRPVALLRSGDAERFVTWPEAPLPPTTVSARLVGAADAVWVVYAEENASEAGAPAWCTVVRIGADGFTAGIDLGRLAVIGADSSGVWASPRPWTSPEDLDGDDDTAPPSFEEYADLPLESRDAFAKLEGAWRDEESAALRSRAMDALQSAEDDEQNAFSWFTTVSGRVPIPPERLTPPPPPGPSPAVDLVRFGADGSVERLTVDRTVMAIEQEGSLTLFTYFPTNPVATLQGSSISYSYPLSRIAVDLAGGLPRALSVGDHDETPLSMEYWEGVWGAFDAAEKAERPDIDLTGVDGIEWPLAPIGPEEREAAVHRIVEQLEGLAEPHIVWTRRDDRVHRVESPYRELKVDVSAPWPDTVVSVEFRNREYPDTLFRRRYRVFDATGRPIPREYLTVHLEEDLATGDHPEPRDGVVEFPDA